MKTRAVIALFAALCISSGFTRYALDVMSLLKYVGCCSLVLVWERVCNAVGNVYTACSLDSCFQSGLDVKKKKKKTSALNVLKRSDCQQPAPSPVRRSSMQAKWFEEEKRITLQIFAVAGFISSFIFGPSLWLKCSLIILRFTPSKTKGSWAALKLKRGLYTENKGGNKTRPCRTPYFIMSMLCAVLEFLIQTTRPLLKPEIMWLLWSRAPSTELWWDV